MEPLRRRALLVGAWLGTAIASGALVAWALRTATPERVTVEGAGATDRAPPPSLAADPRGLPTRAAAPAVPAPVAPRTPSNGPDAGIGDADADPEPPSLAVAWIEVTAVAGPGPAGPAGTAYAFPHDAPPLGAGEEDPWPRVDLDDEGRGRIPLPAAGRWDVGVVTQAAWGITRDVGVVASGTSAVTVRLSATAELEVEVPETGGRSMLVSAERVADTPAARELPTCEAEWGRGGSIESTHGPGIVRLWVPAVPLQVVGRMTDGPRETHVYLGADPAQVTAPARVRLVATSAAPAKTILVSARVLCSAPPPTPRRIRVVFDVQGADGGETATVTSDPEVIAPDEPEVAVSAELPTPPHAVRVSWRGVGVRPGEAIVPAAVGSERRRIEVDVEVDPAACPELLDRVEFLGGRSDAARDGERPFVWVRGLEGVVEALSLEEDGRVSGGAATRIGEPRLAVATDGSWWASEALALPSGGTARFRLVPAGYLHLVPEVPLTPGLGAPQLLRADGGPLTMIHGPMEGVSPEAFDGAVWMTPGVLLGPLPRGEIELVLKLGGVERRRIRATVRAGRITALPLAW